MPSSKPSENKRIKSYPNKNPDHKSNRSYSNGNQLDQSVPVVGNGARNRVLLNGERDGSEGRMNESTATKPSSQVTSPSPEFESKNLFFTTSTSPFSTLAPFSTKEPNDESTNDGLANHTLLVSSTTMIPSITATFNSLVPSLQQPGLMSEEEKHSTVIQTSTPDVFGISSSSILSSSSPSSTSKTSSTFLKTNSTSSSNVSGEEASRNRKDIVTGNYERWKRKDFENEREMKS